MESKEPKPFIQLVQIEELHFSITGLPEELKVKSLSEIGGIEINIDIDFVHNIEEEKLGVNFHFLYRANIGEEKFAKVLEYNNITWFVVKNIPSIKNHGDGTLDIPEQLIQTMLSPAYSTARGIIYSRSAHTFLAKSLLPLTDSNQLNEHFKALQLKKALKNSPNLVKSHSQ